MAGHINRGGYVLGICGGYQILGKTISDPQGIEGTAAVTQGLGYLDVHTKMKADKKVTPTTAIHLASGNQINGYEIHIGETTGNDCSRPFATSNNVPDGAIAYSGQITGTYLHGLFTNNNFRQFFLKNLGLKPSNLDFDQEIEKIKIDKVFIGSCTNGRIEDLREVARVVEGKKVSVDSMIVPGSGLVKEQAESEGLDKIFIDAGFDWREPGCSMCLAMNPDQLKPKERCASTSNRNFEGRQGREGRTHLVSPVVAAASAIKGTFAQESDL